MRWPTLSIRSTALLAIVAGVVAPAILVVFVAQALERDEREQEVRRNRSALMALGAAVMADPAWTVSDASLRQAMAQLLDNPTVCAVEVLGLPGANAARPYLAAECGPDSSHDRPRNAGHA